MTPKTALPADPVSPSAEGAPDPLATLRAVAADLERTSRAHNTRRSYASAFATFRAWAEVNSLASLPATGETIALYLAHLAQAGRKASTADRALAAISQAHVDARLSSPRSAPIVRRVLKGFRRRQGAEPRPKRALLDAEIIAMIDALPSDLGGLRDRAVLALGFATGLRRSELVALDLAHVAPTAEGGLLISVVRSKTDPEGAGRRVRVEARPDAACPVRALEAWTRAAAIVEGAVFLRVRRGGHVARRRISDKTVERVVKNAAELAGLDPTLVSGHSLRSGFATGQAAKGVPERTIMKRLGHTDPAMTRRYVHQSDDI